MPVSTDTMAAWCRALLGDRAGLPYRTLDDYLAAIPRLKSLADLPSGTPVLVRGDVDAKPGPTIGEGDVRLRSMLDTLEFGRDRGWKQVVFGHIGRKPEGSLDKVARRLGELLKSEVPLVKSWLDESSLTIAPEVTQTIASAPAGAVLMLENTRQYKIETVLWKAKPADVPSLAEKLTRLANELAAKVAKFYVNEALSAGSLDASSTVVPAAMDRVALGRYVASEFDGPMMRCLSTELVVFSGLKTDKLDDLEAMIGRGTIRRVFSAGSLAMALKKAAARLEGKDFCLGLAELPENAGQPYYIAPDRVAQAERMLTDGREKGIRFVLPIDFVLADGRVAETLGPQDQQFDVGPKTSELFAREVGEFIDEVRKLPAGSPPAVAFHNGVFGKFEEPQFEQGTRKFVEELRRMKQGGIEVYIGGGEGGTALEKYGQPDWVTHCFTAGGTVLNALGSEPVPYLLSLAMATKG